MEEEWMKRNYRMIVWKLASLERRFLDLNERKKLNYENVKMEMEYRWYRENVLNKKSGLMRVMEKEEMVGWHMVLLVGNVVGVKGGY